MTDPRPLRATSFDDGRGSAPAPAPGPTAAELLDRVARGDEAAMGAFVDLFQARVLGLARRFLRDDAEAEEVTVEVFYKAWKSAGSFRPDRGSVTAWLGAIARTSCSDRERDRGRRRTQHLDSGSDLPDPAADPGGANDARDLSLRVQAALRSLPDEQRIPLLAAYFDGLTYREVAEVRKLPLGTIKTRIRAGLAGMRDLLDHRNQAGRTA